MPSDMHRTDTGTRLSLLEDRYRNVENRLEDISLKIQGMADALSRVGKTDFKSLVSMTAATAALIIPVVAGIGALWIAPVNTNVATLQSDMMNVVAMIRSHESQPSHSGSLVELGRLQEWKQNIQRQVDNLDEKIGIRLEGMDRRIQAEMNDRIDLAKWQLRAERYKMAYEARQAPGARMLEPNGGALTIPGNEHELTRPPRVD